MRIKKEVERSSRGRNLDKELKVTKVDDAGETI